MCIAAGVVMAIIGVNKLGLFFVFSWFAFLATMGFFRAFCVTFPEANRRRYAYLVFFLPSLLFWTAAISKETMMYLSLGLAAYGAARILAHRRGGVVLLVVGTIVGIYVRPQELLLFLGAFAIAGLFRRAERALAPRDAPHPGHGPPGRVVDRRGVAVAGAGQARARVQPHEARPEQPGRGEQPRTTTPDRPATPRTSTPSSSTRSRSTRTGRPSASRPSRTRSSSSSS